MDFKTKKMVLEALMAQARQINLATDCTQTAPKIAACAMAFRVDVNASPLGKGGFVTLSGQGQQCSVELDPNAFDSFRVMIGDAIAMAAAVELKELREAFARHTVGLEDIDINELAADQP